MTNLEWIRSFDKEELVDFLTNVAESYDECIWDKWFNNTYCKHCISGDDRFSFCEVNDYCRAVYERFNGRKELATEKDIILMWLEEEKENEN